MRERVEGAAVSVDDIVAFLEHVSMDAAACASVEESFRAFYPSKVMAIKRTANTATAAKFKTAIVAPMESEVLDVYWAPANRFNRQKSSLGYDVGFRGRDMPPEVMRRRRFWADAAADPASSFPRTWAAIQAIGQSGITMPAAPDGSHGALDTPAVQEMYERKFKSGIASASKEFDKLYACWDDAPLLFWWLNTPGYAPAAVRAILKATHEADSSMLPGGLLPAMPAIPAGTADGHFSRVLGSDDKKSLLVSWVKELGLFNNKERIYELVRMAQSTVTLTDTDDDTLEFVHKYPLLDDWLFFSLDVLPTINLICELSFSQIKQFRNANETQMTTDMKMRCANKITTRPSLRSCRVLTTNQLPLRYHQNMVHIFREQRKELGMSEEQLLAVKRGEAYAQPNDTHPKVIRAADQLNGLIETYSDDAMAEVASVDAKKKVVMRDIKSASAKAFVEKTNKPEATKVSLSERDWEQKKAALRASSGASDIGRTSPHRGCGGRSRVRCPCCTDGSSAGVPWPNQLAGNRQ